MATKQFRRSSSISEGRASSFKLCQDGRDRKSTRLNSSHLEISYAVFCLKKTSAGAKLLHGVIAGDAQLAVPLIRRHGLAMRVTDAFKSVSKHKHPCQYMRVHYPAALHDR